MKKNALAAFSKSVADLKRILEADVALTETDRIFIQNHLLILQMAYSEWKLRNDIED